MILKTACRICKRRFGREEMMHHMQTVHYGDLPYDCKECGANFDSMEDMRAHLQKYHSFSKGP